MRLTASTRPIDGQRAARAMIAWATGDRLALDATLAEVMHDPVGVPGVLFELLDTATSLGERIDPEMIQTLQAGVARLHLDDDQ